MAHLSGTAPGQLPAQVDRHAFVVIGHRGAAGLAAENTLPGFALALSIGCPMLELDVYAIEGGDTGRAPGNDNKELCVIHDDTLDRTTNRQGPVAALQAEELAQIDAGDGAPIPTLSQVADLLREPRHLINGRAAALNIELKGPATAAPVAAFLNGCNDLDVLVSSFDHTELARFRALDGQTPVAPLFHRWNPGWQEVAGRLSACAINLSSRIARASRVRAINDAGYAVFVYTVNTAARARSLAAAGVKGVFTDRPDRLREWLS